VEKRRQPPESVANEAIKSARFGMCRRQLRVGQRTQQRHHSARNPHQHREPNRTLHLLQNEARCEKNSRPNHRSNEQQQNVAQPKCAKELTHFSGKRAARGWAPEASYPRNRNSLTQNSRCCPGAKRWRLASTLPRSLESFSPATR